MTVYNSDNPDCRIFFRCIKDSDHTKLGKRKRSEFYDNPTKRTKHEHIGVDTHDDDQDRIHDFRRVQIVQRERRSSPERIFSADGASPDYLYVSWFRV